MGIQAYLLWEKAGQPDGADFSHDARSALQRQLDQGATIEHLEKSLKAPSPKEPEQPKQQEQPPQAEQPSQPEQPSQDQNAQVHTIRSLQKLEQGTQSALDGVRVRRCGQKSFDGEHFERRHKQRLEEGDMVHTLFNSVFIESSWKCTAPAERVNVFKISSLHFD